MKIILVNSKQFYELWNKMIPAQRITGGLPTPAIVLSHLDTLVLLGDGVVEFGSIEKMTDDITIAGFTETILKKQYFEVG